MSKKPDEVPAVETKPVETPAPLIPENIMQQTQSVASKNKEAKDLKESLDIFNQGINKLTEKIDLLFKPVETPKPVVPEIPVAPVEPPKKSPFKTIEEEINKTWGF